MGLAQQLLGVLADEGGAELDGGERAEAGVEEDCEEEVGVDGVEDAAERDEVDGRRAQRDEEVEGDLRRRGRVLRI